MEIYKLVHYDQEDDSGVDFEKLIGVYSSEKKAEEAIERFGGQAGISGNTPSVGESSNVSSINPTTGPKASIPRPT